MSERSRYPRSTCCVVGCQRWSTLFPGEWLCRDHWMSLPAAWRRVLRRSWRKPYRRGLASAERRLWSRAKQFATLKAAGL